MSATPITITVTYRNQAYHCRLQGTAASSTMNPDSAAQRLADKVFGEGTHRVRMLRDCRAGEPGEWAIEPATLPEHMYSASVRITLADEARAHLKALSAAGVGRHTVAEATGISSAIVQMIADGTREKIRLATQRKILAVTPDCKADGTHIDAAPTWALIDALIKAGDTKRSIARALGQQGAGLKLSRKQVTVRNADKVRRHHDRRMAEIAAEREAAQAAAERTAPVPAGRTHQYLAWLREELGHPKRIARAIGCTEDALRAVLDHPRIKTVPRDFADQVETAYRRLQA